MKIKVFLLFLLMLAFACDKFEISSIQADSFMKYYNTHPVFMSADAKQVGNSGYAVLGTVETLTAGSQICLLRTDQFGNSIDSARYYGRSLDDKAYCLEVLPDGFAILGSSENPQNGKLEVFFIRTNSTGNIIWTRTISGTEDIEAYHFEVDGDGSFVMVGYADRSTSPHDKQIWLFAIDRDGEDLWPSQRTYGGDKDEEGLHLQLLIDGRIAITGNTRSFPVTTLTKNSYVLITNNIGSLVNFVEINSQTDEDASCIRQLEDGSFLIVGTVRNSGTGSDILLRKVSLLMLDDEAKWIYGTSGDDIGKSLIVDGGGFYILGSMSAAGGNTSIGLIRTDLTGSNPAYTNFGQGSQMTGTTFEKTSDSGFIITGSNKHSESHASVILIKTKASGIL